MKNKIRYMLPALVLCMSALFMPVTAHAQGAADTTPPTISAKLSGDTLHIEASDDNSGVDAVFIGDKRVNYRVDNAVDVSFQDYAGTGSQTVGVYAQDFAGNKSDVVNIKNPYYKAPAASTPPAQTSKPSTTKPSASASADPEETPDTKPLTPDGQATVTDDATDEDGKEFYTFTTPNDNVFYLVIDKQRDSENVYFLNAVTEDDLMALAAQEDSKGSESAIPEVPVCDCKDKCEAGAVNTACPVCKDNLKMCTGKAAEPSTTPEETEKPEKESGGGSMIFVLLAIAAVGGAGYYFKVYKPKHDLDDAEDLDDLLEDGDEPEVNEDEQTPAQELTETGQDAAVYDDYPDDYPEDGPEDEPEQEE